MRFEEFTAARLPALLRYAMLLSGDREHARDLVQDVLARALVKWGRIATLDEPYAYVRRMLTNEFLSWRRRRRLTTVPLDDVVLAGREPVMPERPERDDDLRARLHRLPARQRAVLVLRYYEDLSDDEIATVLGCRVGTVRGYASRGLATLRVDLRAEANEGVSR
jgi:RNA polymerase sigma-70 factor (sigma-E family)